MAKITLMPSNQSFSAAVGDNLYSVLTQQGIVINAFCGGNGTCGKCKVKVALEDVSADTADKTTGEEYQLACKTQITGDMIVSISNVSDADDRKAPLYEKVSLPLQPRTSKTYLSLPKPLINDQRPDWERLIACLPNGISYKPTLEMLTKLPDTLRETGFKLTAVIRDDEVIGIEKDDTTSNLYGVAFDIGTTSIVAYLLDLNTGETIAVRSIGNPQRAVGADVISRIDYTNNNPEGSTFLRRKVVFAMNGLINQLIETAGVERDYLYEATIVGNTTMHHLLLGLDPINLASAPFVPVIKTGLNLRAQELGLEISRAGSVYVLPNIAGFVGSDTVGAILATGIYREPIFKLVLDIGTNGEVALGSRDGILVCSTAAGPAFEGAQIRFGMRAADGAIEGVKIYESGVECKVIGKGLPVLGICGSGLIQGAAEMVSNKIIGLTGKMLNPADARKNLNPALAERVHEFEGQNAFLLVPEDESAGQKAIYITQNDIRELQLAKAAISAGIKILMKEINISIQQIEEILLAGAFGSYIDKDSARVIGLVPHLSPEKIKPVGNAAGTGAMLALLAHNKKRDAEKIALDARNIELSSRKDFQDVFVNEMFFPNPDIN